MMHELGWSVVAGCVFYGLWWSGRRSATLFPERVPHRPTTRESYLRLELTSLQGWNVVPGLELRDYDDLERLKLELALVVNAWMAVGWRDERELADVLTKAIAQRWSDRAWFLEVEGKDGEWVQVYQPWVPRVVSKTAFSGVP